MLITTMLSSLIKDHQAKQLVKKDEIDVKRQEALNAANELTSVLVDHLNEGSVRTYS